MKRRRIGTNFQGFIPAKAKTFSMRRHIHHFSRKYGWGEIQEYRVNRFCSLEKYLNIGEVCE